MLGRCLDGRGFRCTSLAMFELQQSKVSAGAVLDDEVYHATCLQRPLFEVACRSCPRSVINGLLSCVWTCGILSAVIRRVGIDFWWAIIK